MDESNPNFILDYVKLNEGTEIPDMFAMWVGIAGVSMALGRRVRISLGMFEVFLNMYIVLVAGSGQKKSTAISLIKPILASLEPPPNIIAQKVTPEALIKALRMSDISPDKQIIRERCEGWVICDEMNTFLNKQVYESGMGPLLTSFFDCSDFAYETLSRGREKLSNVYLGILGASTIDWIASAIPESAVGGGVTSRMVFVYSPERSSPVAWPDYPEEKKVLYERCVRSLRKIQTLEGVIQITDEAKAYYKEEYDRFYRGSPMNYDRTLSGYANRRNIHLIKLAALLAISRTQVLLIHKSDVLMAKKILESAEQYMPMVLALVTSSAVGIMIAKVFEIIKRHTKKTVSGDKWMIEGISRGSLLGMLSHQIISRELNEILDTLTQSKKIRSESNGSEVIYYAL